MSEDLDTIFAGKITQFSHERLVENSIKKPCSECKEMCYVSPATLKRVSEVYVIVCNDCAPAYIEKNGGTDNMTLMPMTETQRMEAHSVFQNDSNGEKGMKHFDNCMKTVNEIAARQAKRKKKKKK